MIKRYENYDIDCFCRKTEDLDRFDFKDVRIYTTCEIDKVLEKYRETIKNKCKDEKEFQTRFIPWKVAPLSYAAPPGSRSTGPRDTSRRSPDAAACGCST